MGSVCCYNTKKNQYSYKRKDLPRLVALQALMRTLIMEVEVDKESFSSTHLWMFYYLNAEVVTCYGDTH